MENVSPDINMETRDKVQGLRNCRELSQPVFLNRLAKGKQLLGETKRFVFLRAAPVRKLWNLFQSQLSRAGE